MKNIKLRDSGFSTIILKDNESTVDVTLQMLHTGLFFDMNGTEVVVNKETLENICTNYNASAAMCHLIDMESDPTLKDISLEEFDNRNAPNQVNHNDVDAFLTVGNVIGLMEVIERNNKAYLLGTVRVKGRENVERVRDKRWRNVSIQFNPETHEFVEISWVVKGAAYEARSLMKNNEEPKLYQNLTSHLSTIQARQNKITALSKQLDATKHLVALCVDGQLSRAQVNKLKPKLSEFENPKAVVELMEQVLPDKRFKPRVIKNQSLMKELLKGKIMATTIDTATTGGDVIEMLKNVSLASDAGARTADVAEDDMLGYSSFADKHMDLIQASMTAYESGDVENGKKFGLAAKKLADECKAGKAKLSEDDIDKSKDSEDVKELAKKLEEEKKQLSQEVTEQLATFKNEISVMLAAQQKPVAAEKSADELLASIKQLIGGNI